MQKEVETKSKLDEKADELRREIDEAGDKVLNNYTLADAMREGSSVTDQEMKWPSADSDFEKACAITASVIALKARGLVE